nr:hypothetical protein [Flammeovirga sp. MY04]
MKRYYVNKNPQSSGEHEVHSEFCSRLPSAGNRFYLGLFSSCAEAVSRASVMYPSVDGCYYCCNECHRG